MTIKIRNRFNFVFSGITLTVLLLNLSLLIYKFVTKSFSYPDFYFEKQTSTLLLFKYNPTIVIISIFFLLLYALGTSIYLRLGFEKTQSSEIVFFLLFLLSFLFDSARLLIFLFYSSGAYSNFIFIFGNCVLLSRILAPLALLSLIIFVSEQERQNIERNLLLLLVTSTFFTMSIPLDTAIVYPNFAIFYSFSKVIFTASIVFAVLAIIISFITQFQNNSKQFTTIGYAMIWLGYLLIFNCTNIIRFILGSGFLVCGTIFYINALHNRYMWEI